MLAKILANLSPVLHLDFSKILIGGSLIIITIFILLLSEFYNKEVKNTYEFTVGVGSWYTVRTQSVMFSLASGLTSAYGGYIWGDGYYFSYLTIIGTILGYVSMQAVLTDYSLHLVDRYLLRISYMITLGLTFVYITNLYRTAETLQVALTPVVIVYLALIGLFFFSSIGPSDIRAMLIFLPFLVAINIDIAAISFVFIGLAIAGIMKLKRIKNDNIISAVPILPYLTVPYMILIPFVPLIIDINRTAFL